MLGLNFNLLVVLVESRIKESTAIAREIKIFDVGTGFGSAMEAVHAGVFPFNGKGAFIDDVVESYHDFLEVDITASNGAEVPEAARVSEVGMAAEDTYGAITVSPPCVFHVHVVNALGKGADEFDVVDSLVA